MLRAIAASVSNLNKSRASAAGPIADHECRSFTNYATHTAGTQSIDGCWRCVFAARHQGDCRFLVIRIVKPQSTSSEITWPFRARPEIIRYRAGAGIREAVFPGFEARYIPCATVRIEPL